MGIEKGDIVSVDFYQSEFNLSTRAMVLEAPQDPGGKWGFFDFDEEQTIITTERVTVTLIKKSDQSGYEEVQN